MKGGYTMLNKLIHSIRYHFDIDYRHNYDNKIKFAKIMQVNNSIISSLQIKKGDNYNAKKLA
jgi:hypothetical protein